MSLDDLTPTQYFGEDARKWKHPDGRVLSLSPTQYRNAVEATLRLTDEQRAAHEHPFHRSGCPVKRTGNCLCDYLAQWDARADLEQTLMDEMAKPLTAFTEQAEAEGRIITIDTLNGRTSEWDGVFIPRDIEGNPMPNDHSLVTEANAALKHHAATLKLQADRLRNTERSLAFWKGHAKQDRRTITGLFILSLAGWSLAIARGIWGF